jgi:putative ABC transport system permease protein
MREKKSQPPLWAEKLLHALCEPALREDLMGDLHERFIYRTRSMSMFRAKLLYIFDVICFIRPYIVRKDWNVSLLFMLPASIRDAKRSLIKDPLYSIMNVGGLSLSIVAFLLIAVYVHDELKYDRHYDKSGRIYRITSEINSSTASTAIVATDGYLGPRLKEQCPEVEETVALTKVQGKTIITYGDKGFIEDKIYKAEHTYFKIFSHRWISGNPENALKSPKSIVLTRTLADRYFGEDPPLSKIIAVAGQPFTVTGVIEDVPSHTDLKFDALLSSDNEFLVDTDYWCITFILARDGFDDDNFQRQLDVLSKQYLQGEVSGSDAEMRYEFERLPDVHFGKAKLFDTPKSSRNNVYIFSVVALFMLAIACINYTNLAVARASRKTDEAVIRKILGARAAQLIFQNLCESFILCCVSLCIAVIAAWALFPHFTALSEKSLRFENVFRSPGIIAVVCLLGFTCVLSAVYPALKWSSVSPKSVLGSRNIVMRKSGMRDTLMVVQFTISIALMICTKVVYDQWKLLSSSNPGFNHEQIIVIDFPKTESVSPARAIDALTRLSFVKGVSGIGYNSLPTSSMDIDGYEVDVQGKNVTRIFNNITVDENYLDLLQIELLQGRKFSSNDIDNSENNVLVNESFVRAMGWTDPVNQVLYSYSIGYEVIGVVKDFHFNSLHKKVEPIIIHCSSKFPEKLMAKVNKLDFNSIEKLEREWRKATGMSLHFEFLDSYFNAQYKNERRMQRVLMCFSLIAIVTASLGLSALVALSAARKSYAFAIRKILGAEFMAIARLIVGEFSRVILISICIAIPFSIFMIMEWLRQFSYKTQISVADCLLPVALSIAIVIVSITYFVVEAASANPVKALRKKMV